MSGNLGIAYVIVADVDGTNEVRYLRHEPCYGYCFFHAPERGFEGAVMFKTQGEAQEVFDRIIRDKPVPMTSGKIFPPTNIQTALGINYARPKATGNLAIAKLTVTPVMTHSIEGEITEPTGYTYG